MYSPKEWLSREDIIYIYHFKNTYHYWVLSKTSQFNRLDHLIYHCLDIDQYANINNKTILINMIQY